MKLAGTNGVRAEYRIVGYQFIEAVPGSDDANWLTVETDVDTPEGRWTFTHADLTAHEAADLAEWLDHAAAGRLRTAPDPVEDFKDQVFDLRSVIDFIEPCISFSLRQWSPNALELRLHFGHEGLPPWADGSEYRRYDFYCVLSTTPDELAQAAAAFALEAREYPVR
jgi:hypothetical protein